MDRGSGHDQPPTNPTILYDSLGEDTELSECWASFFHERVAASMGVVGEHELRAEACYAGLREALHLSQFPLYGNLKASFVLRSDDEPVLRKVLPG
jgi:hypothetical protein